jgi:hypothetical protein
MDKFILYHFAVVKNGRVYKFSCQPGSPWEDAFDALDEVKFEFQKQQEAEKQAQAAKAASEQPAPADSVEPEVVQPDSSN